MKNNNEFFWEIQRTLSWEFDRYILAHSEVKIPMNALISFRMKGNDEFNKWSKDIAQRLREPKQPLLVVKIEGLTPPPPITSRLINPHLEVVSK